MAHNTKTSARLRRARRTRAHIRNLGVHRLSIHRSARHIYAQVCTADGSHVLVSASSLDKKIRTSKTTVHKNNIALATKIGTLIAKNAKDAGISKVAFDRSGFKYHGRVKALADAAREGGLLF